MKINIPMDIDVPLLVQQKIAILRAFETAEDADHDLLHGILTLLDQIHELADPI
jgi:hypothetical protein